MNITLPSNILFISLLTIFMPSCEHQHSEDEEHQHQHATASTAHGPHSDTEHQDGIHLSQEQMKVMDIQLGDFSEIKINDYVQATGTLGLPPNALTSVSAKARGFIKGSNKYVEGDYVKKGVIMAYLENPEFIQEQQEYLEIAAELEYDQLELQRQHELLAAGAGVLKNVQQLEATVAVKTAQLNGLTNQLRYIGIDAERVTAKTMVNRIAIYAPMSGYITSIIMHNGMYVTPEMELMEIVNENHLHLELDVFEQDIAAIKVGQHISYTVPALGTSEYEGEVHVMGKELNAENKTVRIHGHLEADRPTFIKDLFLTAKIWLNDQTVQALPEGAIIQEGEYALIFASTGVPADKEVSFEPIRVITKQTDNGYTAVQLIDEIPAGMQVVVSGAYYVSAQSKVGELEHSH